jgi:uncharacterized repeat protein (TIGR01451 family)
MGRDADICPSVACCAATYVVPAGDQLQYTITATNSGGITLKNVDVQDTMVSSALACSISQSGSASATTSLPAASLARSAVLQCTGTRSVTVADVTTKSVTNRATVSATKLTQANAYAEAQSSLLAMQVVISTGAASYASTGEYSKVVWCSVHWLASSPRAIGPPLSDDLAAPWLTVGIHTQQTVCSHDACMPLQPSGCALARHL